MPADVLRNPSLSFDARGLLAFIVTCDYLVTLPDMVEHSTDGTHTVRVALDELVQHGLVSEVVR